VKTVRTREKRIRLKAKINLGCGCRERGKREQSIKEKKRSKKAATRKLGAFHPHHGSLPNIVVRGRVRKRFQWYRSKQHN